MSKKILLVDDQEDILSAASEALESFGHNVITGHNGNDAIKLFEKEKPDLLILDVRMPIKDGYEAYFDIKNRHKEAKIILMSAYPIESSLYTRIREQEIVYFLNKPFSLDSLREIIDEVMQDDK